MTLAVRWTETKMLLEREREQFRILHSQPLRDVLVFGVAVPDGEGQQQQRHEREIILLKDGGCKSLRRKQS